MNIIKWAGLVTAASPYSLPAGATTRQNNLQIRKVGQLVPRNGLRMVYQNRIGAMLALHRLTSGASQNDKLLAFRISEPGDLDYDLEVISVGAGNALTSATVFSIPSLPVHRPSFCEDRNGTSYIFFGSGIRPQIFRKDASATLPCGLDSPTVAPVVVGQGDGFFIERVDVMTSGTSYYRPPTLTVSGGGPTRNAEVRAVVQGGQLVAVDVLDGGSNFQTMPNILVSDEQVGVGFLARGIIASSTATYGFAESASPATSGTYTAGFTHAFDTTEFPAKIAYRLPGSSTTSFVTASFDSSTALPSYTALIPLGPVVAPATTTTTIPAASTNQIVVASVSGILVGTELSISTVYFDANPIVTSISGTTLTLSRNTKPQGASVSSVPVSVVAPVSAFAQVRFNSISGAWRLGNTAPSIGTSGTLNTTQNVAGGTAYKYYSVRQNWQTADDYYQNIGNGSGTPNTSGYALTGTNMNYVDHRYNRDCFWGLMPSLNGYVFGQNQIVYKDATTTTYGNVFWPDYSRISYRVFSGQDSQIGTESQWQLSGSDVVYEARTSPFSLEPYIDITLTPMKKSNGTSYAVQAGTRHPKVRVYLGWNPLSWDVSSFNPGDDAGFPCSTNLQKFYSPQIGAYRRLNYSDTDPQNDSPGNSGSIAPIRTCSGWILARSDPRLTTAKRWANSGASIAGGVPWQVVDFRPEPNARTGNADAAQVYGVGARTIEIIDPGAQLERGTRYVLRFEQYNAYDYVHVNAAYSENWLEDPALVPANLSRTSAQMYRNGAWGTTFTDFYFEATDLDTSGSSALLLLPGQITPGTTPKIVVSGAKWASGQTAAFTLRQKDPNAANPNTTEVNGQTFTFTASEILPATATQRIGDVTIISGGANYYRAPTILVRDGGGYGLRLASRVSNGQVIFVQVLEGGDGYTSSPTLYTSVEPATLLPVMRGTMQGTYRCAYRYADYSQTVVANPQIATTSGSTSATLNAASSAIKPGMKVTGHAGLRHMTTIVSVNGTSVTLSHAATSSVSGASAACVVRDMELPVAYSDFSPITDVEADVNGSGRASSMVWSLPGVVPPGRADHIEFYRTSSDQSLVFYRLEQYGTVSGGNINVVGTDTLSDEELFDTERANYASLPVVLPNGALNAYRFGVPRTDMSAAVAWQDRLWYGVSTSGDAANTVFFSEYDEFESCPDINEIPIQNNLRTSDYLTALVPYGSVLMAMQTAHCYAITFNTDPGVDTAVQLAAHRGCLCQQAWDVFDDLLYVADERGVYRIARSGAVENLSDPIRNLFDENGLNLQYRANFFLKVDQIEGVLRFFYVPAGVDSPYPTRAACFHIANQAWWTETWPNALAAASDFRSVAGRQRPVYGAVDGCVYDFGGTRDCTFRDIQSVAVTNGGSGYVTPPEVTVSGGSGRGAVLKALIVDGAVTEILVIEGGYGYGGYAGDNFVASVALTIDPPPSGTTATATATAREPLSSMGNLESPPNRTTVAWSVRTGPMTLLSESTDRRADGQVDRSVSVTYRPTSASKTLILREYYNNSDHPRPNVMRRDRGTGFLHETTGAKSTLNMAASRSPLGLSTGQAKAQFAGRSLSDVGSADKHVAVELSCDAVQTNAATDPPEALIYTLEVQGVVDGD